MWLSAFVEKDERRRLCERQHNCLAARAAYAGPSPHEQTIVGEPRGFATELGRLPAPMRPSHWLRRDLRRVR